ncbi:MAG: hypothetical protein WAL38_26850 [Solirubrobacteraceae bacterium]
MTLATMSVVERDPRMQLGAYITDGIDLYEVTGIQRGPGVMGMSTVRIMVENCRNLRCLEFLPDKIRMAFELVRVAPVGLCPDVIDDIPWDPSLPEARAA